MAADLGSVVALNSPATRKGHVQYDEKQNLQELLIVSPYTSHSHLFDTRTVSQPNRLLAKALTVLEPVRDDYAIAPYVDIFNWPQVMARVRALSRGEGYLWPASSFYVVVFRSQVPPTTDRSHLAALDAASHEEAIKSGGLLK